VRRVVYATLDENMVELYDVISYHPATQNEVADFENGGSEGPSLETPKFDFRKEATFSSGWNYAAVEAVLSIIRKLTTDARLVRMGIVSDIYLRDRVTQVVQRCRTEWLACQPLILPDGSMETEEQTAKRIRDRREQGRAKNAKGTRRSSVRYIVVLIDIYSYERLRLCSFTIGARRSSSRCSGCSGQSTAPKKLFIDGKP
jgi:hypothetical protein